ncbi:hypothetical protein BLNAU_1942 [Blattamonas nauphoetae]|uniref:Uncharacterized protein n=1 Tax=Blattamonas nauphoetae TaxID=2049346 RepID=A0ABQ9YGP7_9EUKA|nr:hypothetical protein BLNAU_1942 [Blattamonas nauphoetae]
MTLPSMPGSESDMLFTERTDTFVRKRHTQSPKTTKQRLYPLYTNSDGLSAGSFGPFSTRGPNNASEQNSSRLLRGPLLDSSFGVSIPSSRTADQEFSKTFPPPAPQSERRHGQLYSCRQHYGIKKEAPKQFTVRIEKGPNTKLEEFVVVSQRGLPNAADQTNAISKNENAENQTSTNTQKLPDDHVTAESTEPTISITHVEWKEKFGAKGDNSDVREKQTTILRCLAMSEHDATHTVRRLHEQVEEESRINPPPPKQADFSDRQESGESYKHPFAAEEQRPLSTKRKNLWWMTRGTPRDGMKGNGAEERMGEEEVREDAVDGMG